MVRKIAVALLSVQMMSAMVSAVAFSADGARFEVGPYASKIVYEEPGYMKDSGSMYGINASASWRGRYLSMFDSFRIDALAGRGSVDYTSVSSGSMPAVDDTMIEARALFGREFPRRGELQYSSYTGFGYRRLTDNSGGRSTTAGKAGYDRESQYLYMPVGLEAASKSGSGWSFDGRIEYDIFLKGIQKSALSQTSSATYTRTDITNDQYEGYGIKVSARFSRPVSGSASVAFEPFFRYWNIGVSRVDYSRETDADGHSSAESYVEPANHSTEYGLNAMLAF